MSASVGLPTIITIVVDDFGYTDVSYNGGLIPTPFLDELSSDGVRLDRYYTHPVCTPSRLSMLTGKYSHLSGFGSGGVILGPGPYSLPANTETMPKALKQRGYTTHAVGKWHVGSTRPKDVPTGSSWGFDSFIGLLHGAGGHYSKTVSGSEGLSSAFYDYSRGYPNGTWTPVVDDRHTNKALTEEAVTIIKNHKDSYPQNEKPLFLYLGYTAGHTPLQADQEWLDKCQHLPHPIRRAYCGLIVGADEGIKNVTMAVKKYLGENAVVIFTTDNGGMLHVGGLNTPLRGGKNMGYEGGVRTVAFVADLTTEKRYFPNKMTYKGLIHIADWMPTLVGIVDRTANSGAGAKSLEERACGADRAIVPPKSIGYGYDQWCAMVRNGESPRKDGVLALDDHTNFVSYIKPPYKMMLGFIGSGEWAAGEPKGRYLYPEATVLQMFEEELQVFLDDFFNTRDISFFWHEILHIMIAKLANAMTTKKVDFQTGFPVLGSIESGDVLASTVLKREDIPIEVYNVYDDPTETINLFATHKDVVADMLKSFNEHWKHRPKMFDFQTTCVDHKRYKVLPQSQCATRTSHLAATMDQRGTTNTIPCRFEQPFIADNDPKPCGSHAGAVEPINLIEQFRVQIVSVVRKVLLAFIVVMVVVVYAAWSCCCKKKQVKKTKTN